MEPNYQLDHRMKLARDFESQGKLLHAAQIYSSILDEEPEFTDVYFSLANLYERMGSLQSALSLLNSLLEERPDDKDIRLFFGQFLLRNARWEEASDVLSYIMPEDEPIVSFFIGYSHFMLNEYEIAKINFLNFIAYEKQSELLQEANIYLAKIELKLKNYENALSYAKKADAVYSNFWELNLIYAETYYKMGMYAHAVPAVEKTITLSPEEPAPYEWAGKIYLKLGDYAKAEKNFLRYIENISDASSDIYTKLAEACLKGKKTKDALAYYDIAIKLDPGNKQALAGKNKAYSILNDKASDG